MQAMLDDWTRVVPPGGESYSELRERVSAVLEEVVARNEDTLLVAHNGPLSTAMTLLLDMPDVNVNRLWFEQGLLVERGRRPGHGAAALLQ